MTLKKQKAKRQRIQRSRDVAHAKSQKFPPAPFWVVMMTLDGERKWVFRWVNNLMYVKWIPPPNPQTRAQAGQHPNLAL